MGGSSPKQYESFDREAAEQRATLVRGEWEDYKSRFAPWEDRLIDFQKDPGVTDRAVDSARESTNQRFDVGIGEYQRNKMRLGESGLLGEGESRGLDLAKAKSSVQATNDARAYSADRKEKIMSGGLGSASARIRS
tara:strand:- start:241 stop:648 length:408 start_codon:yes stop_codon:yes gene_type:complete